MPDRFINAKNSTGFSRVFSRAKSERKFLFKAVRNRAGISAVSNMS